VHLHAALCTLHAPVLSLGREWLPQTRLTCLRLPAVCVYFVVGLQVASADTSRVPPEQQPIVASLIGLHSSCTAFANNPGKQIT